MRTDLFRFSDLVPFTCVEHSWPCEAVCALRLRSEINKSYRDEIRVLFISAREFVYHAASHGQLNYLEVSRKHRAVQLAGGNQE